MKLFERTNPTSTLDTPPKEKKGRSKLLIGAAVLLSMGSLLWTGWSVSDLMGVGQLGLTVAVAIDVGWAAIITAEARGSRKEVSVAGYKFDLVPALGWALLLLAMALLAWHGASLDGQTRNIFGATWGPLDGLATGMGGPTLPLLAKIVWFVALLPVHDPSALTKEEQDRFADMDRAEKVADREHAAELANIRRSSAVDIERTRTQFEAIRARQEFENELALLPAPIRIPSVRADVREPAELPANPSGEHSANVREPAELPANPSGEHSANPALTSANLVREPAEHSASKVRPGFGFGFAAEGSAKVRSIAEVAREKLAECSDTGEVVRAVLAELPNANPNSVAATVRKVRKH